MDNPITHLSLCAGYGGIDLGLRRVIPSLRTICYVEIEAFAIVNLAQKIEKGWLDPAPIWTNLKTFEFSKFHGKVDILTGGFPCQPFSQAGKRAGADDERHLWPYIEKGIRDLGRPPVVFFENVEGIISTKIGDQSVLHHVLIRLEQMGYKATAGVFSASEVGASHQRKRVFIMGMLNGVEVPCSSEGRVLAHPAKRGAPQFEWEPPRQTQSTVGRAFDGDTDWMDISKLYTSCDSRVDEIRMLGNGVVPDTCAVAFRTLWKELVNTDNNVND